MLNEIFQAALGAVDPETLIRKETADVRNVYEKGRFKRLVVIGFGKASFGMARAIEEGFSEKISDGLIITKYGHGGTLGRIKTREAAHPIPDYAGLRATEEVLSLLRSVEEKTLVVTLISGGGSALLVRPAEGVSLSQKQKTTDLLLRSGADIHEVNTVRKHISAVKGGRLAEAAHPARMLVFIISDVLGDSLDVIASGPTSPDPSTYKDAHEVLLRRGMLNEVPGAVKEFISQGMRGERPETPKPGSPVFSSVENTIVGTNSLALGAAKEKAAALGLEVEVLTSELKGEAREAGRWLAKKALEAKEKGRRNLCLISGGETTVTVKGKGKGGRNMELALSFALEIEGKGGISLLSGGTDGTDGPTDSAGAVVDGLTAVRARQMGLDPLSSLGENDSYGFFEKTGGLLKTGPTGTNVMDVEIALINGD